MSDSALHPGLNSTLDSAFAKESNTVAIEAGLGFLTLIATVSLLLRIYVRAIMIKKVGADDYTAIIALICTVGAYAAFVAQGFYGLGKHKSTITADHLVTFQKIQFFQTILNAMLGQCMVKISASLMLMRFATRPMYKNCLWGIIGIMSAYTIASVFIIVLQCIPTAGFWDPKIKATAKCYPFEIFLIWGKVSTALNITTDVILSTLPIPLIWQLQLKIRAKISLIAILSLAYCATAAGIAKIVFQIAYANAPDKTFHQSLQVCGFVELGLSIIATNAPTLKPLFKTLLRLTTSNYGTYGTSGGAVQHSGLKKRQSIAAGYLRQPESDGTSSSEAIRLQVFDGNGKSRSSTMVKSLP